MEKIKTRMAPSPTGYLHIGTAHTTFFNWLFARKNKGEFILRIEDTDLERSKPEYEKNIMEGLKWLDLNWDNKEIIRQSDRLEIYEKYLKQLLESGKAFWCDHSKEELEQEQKEQTTNKQAPRHLCGHKGKNLTKGQVIRLSVNTNSKEKISFNDEIRGNIETEEGLLGDLSLAKDLRTPLYNFAVVVDDIDMKISHVIRGEDHISNTPKQVLIYQALQQTQGKPLEIPKFAHLPLILGSDRSKLSKRYGETSISEYKKDYLPEAMLNFMGFLGYTYSKEVLTKEEMIQEFELAKVHKSGAIFDVKKLNWINSQYIKNLSADKLISLSTFREVPKEAIPLITERLEKLSDVQGFDYFWKNPEYDKELLVWKKSTLEKSLETLVEVKKIIEDFDFKKGKEELRKILDIFSSRVGGRGLIYWPLRVALTGKEKSPDPVDMAFIIGKDKVLKRIDNAIKKLEQ